MLLASTECAWSEAVGLAGSPVRMVVEGAAAHPAILGSDSVFGATSLIGVRLTLRRPVEDSVVLVRGGE